MVAKRKRSESHSELDKFVHQSGVLLQREGKKIRTFLARKRVQQLKQAQTLLQEAETVKPSADGVQDKQTKRLQKARALVAKLETELKVLKALGLKALVRRAAEKTGLKTEQELKQQYAQQDEQADDDDDEMNAEPSSDFEAEGSDGESDGFDSEEYENKPSHSSQENSDAEEKPDEAPELKPSAHEAKQQTPAPKQPQDKLELALVDAILTHKQMIPLLKAIEQRYEGNWYVWVDAWR